MASNRCILDENGIEWWNLTIRQGNDSQFMPIGPCESLRFFLKDLERFCNSGFWRFLEQDLFFVAQKMASEVIHHPIGPTWSQSHCLTNWARNNGRVEIETCTEEKPLAPSAPRWWWGVHLCWEMRCEYGDKEKDCEKDLYIHE